LSGVQTKQSALSTTVEGIGLNKQTNKTLEISNRFWTPCGVRWSGGRQMRVWSLKMAIFASFVHCLRNILHTWSQFSFHMMPLSMTLATF